jgi:hypothetical protein
MTDLMPKLKYCLFAVSQPTQKIRATPQILLPFKGGGEKNSEIFVPVRSVF